jgi:glycosyltransferase involved in cell wall biosynthesis
MARDRGVASRSAAPPAAFAPTVVFTIASRNYIAQAATLMQSVRTAHPDLARLIVLADEAWDFGQIDLAADLLVVEDLRSPAISNMKWWYDILEFNTAVKPYAFLHLFRQGFGQAIYLDPDILLLAPMTEVLEGLARHSLVLTPHITAPLPTEGEPCDLTIMKSGVWNCGFIALRNDDDGQRLARWWADRLLTQCRSDVASNLFTDQRWIDLAPCFVTEVLRLRHPGYNAAYWNLPYRRLSGDPESGWRADDGALVFFHFSGFAIDKPDTLSRYDTRFTHHDSAPLAALCALYAGRVRANGWERIRSAPYAFARFPDGRPNERTMRRWLLRAIDDRRLNPRRPLAISAAFFDQADEEAAGRGIVLTRLAHQLWRDRIDLQRAFDLTLPSQAAAYRDWLAGGEAERQGVSAQSIAAVADLLPGGQPAWEAWASGDVELTSGSDGPALDAIGQATSHTPPPWPSIAEELPTGEDTAAAVGFVSGQVIARMPDGDVALDRQAALAWERRDDVRRGFPLRSEADVRGYVCWAMTQGVLEAAIEPALLDAGFIATLAAPTAAAALYGDVPITLLMQLTRGVETDRRQLTDFDRFPGERRGRLSHALWFALIAPARFHWPEPFFAAVRDWLRQPSNVTIPTPSHEPAGEPHTVSRGLMAIWELRADVQRRFPLQSAAGVRAYLHWAAFQGLPELGITAAAIDPGLLAWLAGPAAGTPGISEQVAAVYALRDDVRRRFDISAPGGVAAVQAWGERYFAGEYHHVLGIAGETPPAEPIVIRKAVALTGQWSVPSGRGEDVRGTVQALLAVGFTDFVVIDRDRDCLVDAGGAILAAGVRLTVAVNIIHLNANTAFEDWRFLRHMVVAERTVSWWAWELERLPTAWRHAFTFADEIWASTNFAHAAFAREAARPVRLVPLAVSADDVGDLATDPGDQVASRAALGIADSTTLYFFAFDYRSYIARKNPEGVIAAFLEAFPQGGEPACLLIKTQGAAQAPAAARRLRALVADSRIRLWDSTLDRAAMLRLIADCNCYVSLHRSEGFGRGPAEAMLLGKPVILTDYSGTRDFADAACALPIRCSQRPVGASLYPGGEDQNWAEPSVSDAARAMRWVMDHPQGAAALGARARARIAALYAPDVVGAAILRALDMEKTVERLERAAAE